MKLYKKLLLALSANCGVFIILFSKDCANQKQKDIAYRGTLVEVFRDHKNMSQHTYKIETDRDFVYEPVRLYPQSIDYIEVGDSIIKNGGDLSIMVKKPNGMAMKFSYK